MKMAEKFKNEYLKLIKFRLKDKLPEDSDFHLHHIVPKFMMPKKNALIKLTPKEHCLAHYYLWRGFCKSESKVKVQYLFNAYKGLSVAFGNDYRKRERMMQFIEEIEHKYEDLEVKQS